MSFYNNTHSIGWYRQGRTDVQRFNDDDCYTTEKHTVTGKCVDLIHHAFKSNT